VRVIAQLRDPALDAIAQIPGCTGILSQDEVKDVREITCGLAAPDDVHQAEDFRRSLIRVRS
jgi:hypothetical protein